MVPDNKKVLTLLFRFIPNFFKLFTQWGPVVHYRSRGGCGGPNFLGIQSFPWGLSNSLFLRKPLPLFFKGQRGSCS